MRILYLTHGKPNFENYNHLYNTFIDLGHDVLYYNYNSYLDKDNDDLQKYILDIAKNFTPDIVFTIILKEEIAYETFDKLRKMGILIVCWFSDDSYRYFMDRPLGTRFWLPYIDYAITTHGKALEWYKDDNFKNVIYSQWGANPKYFKPMKVDKIYDVVLTGQNHGQREKIVNAIKKAGIDIYAFGNNFPSGRITTDELVKITNQARININVYNNLPAGDKAITTRNFEIPMCRGFLISEYLMELEQYYNPDEMVYWNNVDDLIDKIKYYLYYEKEAELIAYKSYDRAINNHTWKHRFEIIFNELEKAKEI